MSTYGVSADATVIAAGTIRQAPGGQVPVGYGWTVAGGWQAVGIDCQMEAVSGDGSTFVGEEWVDPQNPHSYRAFYWRPPAAPTYLDPEYAYAVNGDGTVIVGARPGASGQLEAFRWTAAGGHQTLPHLFPPSTSGARSPWACRRTD